MRVDLKSLGTFNRIGSAGAKRAASALSSLTGEDTFVDGTTINFSPVEHAETELSEKDTRVAIEFEGALDGRALLVFDSRSADYVLSNLEGAGPDPDPAYLEEVANIMTSSFVDGWAENLSETIDISTPSPLGVDQPLVPEGQDIDGSSFVFSSTIAVEGTDHHCRFLLVPEPTSFVETLREGTEVNRDTVVDIDELTTFLRLTAAGAETVSEQLEMMTGIETDVTVSHLNFVPIEAVPDAIDQGTYEGTVFQFEGEMDGYLAVLFDRSTAASIAGAMLPGAADDPSMRQNALEELGNITASGFIDGWANALETTIDHSVPDFVDDMGRALLESIAAQLAQSQDFAYVFDVVITADSPMECRVFAFPEEQGLQAMISSLDADLDVADVERL